MPKEYSSSHFVAISARGPWGLLLCDCAGDVPSVPRLRTSGALPRPGDSHTAACLQGAHGPLSRSSPLRRGPLAHWAGLDRQRSRLGAPGPCACGRGGCLDLLLGNGLSAELGATVVFGWVRPGILALLHPAHRFIRPSNVAAHTALTVAATGTLSDAGLPSQGSLSAAFALFPAAATEMLCGLLAGPPTKACVTTWMTTAPAEYLQPHRLDLCSVCGLLVGRRYNGVHPRCRPHSRHHVANHGRASAQDPGLPSFSTIMGHTAPTLRRVPHVARAAWAQCLARAVAAAATTNTGPAWQELLMLPKAVLAAPLRGGGRHHKQAALSTLRRCQRWLAGERMELWDELVQPRPSRARADGVELAAQHTRCCALAAEGELSRACAALTEPPPLPPSRATLEALAAQNTPRLLLRTWLSLGWPARPQCLK